MAQHEVEILLVEDNPVDVELTLHALRNNNLANRIQVVRDGEEALDFLFARGAYSGRNHDTPPKLILLDLKLPKVDGLEVLREIKNNSRTRPIPVVILTTSQAEEDIVRAYELHANCYITKPVDLVQFTKIVRTIEAFWLTIVTLPPK